MARVRLDLLVPDKAKFQNALSEARTQGLDVSRSFVDLGMISGSIEAKAIGGLVHIEGIASVVPARRATPSRPRQGSSGVVPFRRA